MVILGYGERRVASCMAYQIDGGDGRRDSRGALPSANENDEGM